MTIERFKKNIDRGIREPSSKKAHLAAADWASEANMRSGTSCRWEWNPRLCLDYGGSPVRIGARFYAPGSFDVPNKKWKGRISLDTRGHNFVAGKELEADTLDELRGMAEEYVRGVENKIINAVKAAFE